MMYGAIIAFKINHIVHNATDILISVGLMITGGTEFGLMLIYDPKPKNGSKYIDEISSKLTANQTQLLVVYLFITAH